MPIKQTLLCMLVTVLPLASADSSHQRTPYNYPTRTIAGVSVVDTPIVQAAEQFAISHTSHAIYKHIMRSWLYGVLMIDANQTLSEGVDREVHAIASILHDLGWDQTANSTVISPDKRFEVDGAIAARKFIENHDVGGEWGHQRVQLVWDAIALHTERSIAYFKELDVQVVSKGISMDFSGPSFGVSPDKYNAVEHEFPKNDLKDSVNQTFIWLCQTKPATTYDTWMQPWGDAYVEGYNTTGKRRFDLIFRNLTAGSS